MFIITDIFSSGNVDYLHILENITFTSSDVEQFIFIPIINDILVEKTEDFFVILELYSYHPAVHLEPRVIRIYIFDDDRKYIKMTNTGFLYFLISKDMYTIFPRKDTAPTIYFSNTAMRRQFEGVTYWRTAINPLPLYTSV